jgi:hypothetical protein
MWEFEFGGEKSEEHIGHKGVGEGDITSGTEQGKEFLEGMQA